ncbi:MAG: hypothetical protein F6K18_12090 [Okeania sp. SIO2C2]|nr:hypothetical protein [Okeania sp. SIO2C2]NEP87505.1 hypothetical protein [Okeania sp. SIO2C2]
MVIIRVCAQKFFSRSRRQETGEMARERGGRSNNFPKIVLSNSCLKY